MIDNAFEVVSEYADIVKEIGALEKRRDALKPKLAELTKDQEKVSIPFAINRVPYEYIVSKITQDKRTIDPKKLAQALLADSCTAFAVKYEPVPDEDAVRLLAANDEHGIKDKIKESMIGDVVTYSKVTRREVKIDND